jgi:predicted transcriptional regulator
MRLRDIADCVGITERASHRIVCELEEAGYLTRRREGRRNVYDVHPQVPLPHPLERNATVGDLLAAVAAD